jgi:hypothetical protein
MGKEVTLELLNPMGVIEQPQTLALRPRLSDLADKKIALVNNIKPGVLNLFDVLEELLKQKYPGITVLRGYKPGPMAQAQEEHFQMIARNAMGYWWITTYFRTWEKPIYLTLQESIRPKISIFGLNQMP